MIESGSTTCRLLPAWLVMAKVMLAESASKVKRTIVAEPNRSSAGSLVASPARSWVLMSLAADEKAA